MNELYIHTKKNLECAVNKALKYLMYRSRTVFEIKVYLHKKGFGDDIVHDVIVYLEEKKYLDDVRFCRRFIEYQTQYKPKSRFALAYELKKKGIAPQVVESALSGYNDDQAAITAVQTKMKQWGKLEDTAVLKKKITNFLRYRGFGYQTCTTTLSIFIKDEA